MLHVVVKSPISQC